MNSPFPQTPQAAQNPPVNIAIDKTFAALDALENLLGKLESRLNFVSIPSIDKSNVSQPEKVPENVSPLGLQIYQIEGRIVHALGHIEALINRLEV